MIRNKIGAALLIALLVLGALGTWVMEKNHRPIAEALDQASRSALAGDWEKAQRLAREAQDRWEKNWHFSAAFTDHGPMERIDSLFARLEVTRKARERIRFAELCAQLAQEAEGIGEAHGLHWWNLL